MVIYNENENVLYIAENEVNIKYIVQAEDIYNQGIQAGYKDGYKDGQAKAEEDCYNPVNLIA